MDIWVCGFKEIVQKRCWIWWGLERWKWMGKKQIMSETCKKTPNKTTKPKIIIKKKRQKGELALGNTQGGKISSEERLQEKGRQRGDLIKPYKNLQGMSEDGARQELLSSWTFLITPVCYRNAGFGKAHLKPSSNNSGFPSPLQDF